ncbi:MAG: hypothetical protein WAW96_16170, partial [Alphaproteobacteria bacterium]
TDLILARKRVKFSGLLATWMIMAMLMLFNNWVSLWSLSNLKYWSLGEIALQFSTAIVQYFTCSLVSIKVERHEPADMPAFFQDERPVIMASMVATMTIAMIGNYLDRNTSSGGPNGWVGPDIADAVGGIPLLLAAFAKPRWLQWLAAILMLSFVGYFLVSYTGG